MNNYIVEVHKYPKEYAVRAEDESEAREKARQMHNDEDGESIYETVVREA